MIMSKIKLKCEKINSIFNKVDKLQIKRDDLNKAITILELIQSIKLKCLANVITPLVVEAIELYNTDPFDTLVINPNPNSLNISLGKYDTKSKIQLYSYPTDVIYKGEVGVAKENFITPAHSFEITKILKPIFQTLLGEESEWLEIGEVSLKEFYYYDYYED